MPKMYDGPSVLWYLLKKIWKYYQNYQSASYDRTTEIENTRLAWEIQLAEACIDEKESTTFLLMMANTHFSRSETLQNTKIGINETIQWPL